MNIRASLIAVSLGAIAIGNTPATSAVIYDNFSVEGFTVAISDLSYSAVFKSNTNQTINGIGARLTAPNAGDVKFVLFDLGHDTDPSSTGILIFA